jgi:hypothetical protein
MPRLYSSAQIIKTLEREGFKFVSQKGSHAKYRKTGNPVRTVSEYYWLGRDIDVDDIFAYRRALVARRPKIKGRAEAALARFFDAIGVASPTNYEAWRAPA